MSKTRLRLVIALSILAVLTVWPLLHMAISRVTGFAPSRLGGWGMYAAQDEALTGVEIFVLAPGAELPAGVLGKDSPHRPDGLVFPFEVHLTVVTPTEMRALDGSGIEPEQLDALWDYIQRVRAFPGKGSAARLAAYLRSLSVSEQGTGAVLIILATPGIDMSAGHGRVALRAFVVADGEVQEVSESVVGADALQRAEDEIRSRVAGGSA
jgi:hypothetical protein